MHAWCEAFLLQDPQGDCQQWALNRPWLSRKGIGTGYLAVEGTLVHSRSVYVRIHGGSYACMYSLGTYYILWCVCVCAHYTRILSVHD